jgi:hypothetical protein
VKLQKRLGYQDFLDAARQSERNAVDLQTPVAILKRPRDHDRNALVVMRLETFAEWFLPPKHAEECSGPVVKPVTPDEAA